MSETTKPWYKSKAVWGGGLLFVGGLLTTLGKLAQGETDLNALFVYLQPLLLGLGVVGLRLGTKQVA